MNPYLVLNVALDADDATIRRAYLEAVKEATPEARPARFKEVVAAYEQIKDERSRNAYELLNTDGDGDTPAEAYLAYARVVVPRKPLTYDAMLAYLREHAKP